MTRIEEFKKNLARVFDNDLRTKQWGNYVDYAIIVLIIINTLSVFISTFHISPAQEKILLCVVINVLKSVKSAGAAFVME